MAILAFGRVHVTLCRSVLRQRRENRAAPMERCFGNFQSGETLFTRRAAACSDRGTEEGQSCAGLRGRWIYRSPPRKAVIVQLGLGLYVSPVRFNCNIVPEQWGLAYSLTRMVGVIDGFRWCVREGNSALGEGFLPSLAVAGLFVWFGIRQLRKMERSFADSI
jgi:hypothetical protein